MAEETETANALHRPARGRPQARVGVPRGLARHTRGHADQMTTKRE
jgi:hypothetical protein